MIATEVQLDFSLPPPKTPRSAGVHVSGIIRAIATETGILKKEWAEELSLTDAREITDPTAILRISIGLAWEEWYIPTILGPYWEVVDHPGELELEGVYMTHDGESVSTILARNNVIVTPKRYELIIHEVKATYKSTKTVGDLSSQWMWLAQIKAYCRARQTRFAVLHALFLCGDYSWPIRPKNRVWQIEFTTEELEDNWYTLMEYKNQRLALENWGRQ